MLIQDIVKKVNQKLAGELLTRRELIPHLDDVIDDINNRLNSTYPAFSELPYDATSYDYFPDHYIRKVVVLGAAHYFYMMDEEGGIMDMGFATNYQQELFYMVRDFIEDVPFWHRRDSHQGSVDFNLTGAVDCGLYDMPQHPYSPCEEDFIFDTLPIEHGGTGADNLEDAKRNLGISQDGYIIRPITAGGTGAATVEEALVMLRARPLGIVPFEEGGTGAINAAQARINLELGNVMNYPISDSSSLDSSTTYASSKALYQAAEIATEASAAVSNKVGPSAILSAVITTNWVGAAPPYTQSVTVMGVSSTSIQDITLSLDASIAEVDAWQKLGAYGAGQSSDTIVIKTLNSPNLIPIPVKVIIRGG